MYDDLIRDIQNNFKINPKQGCVLKFNRPNQSTNIIRL